MTSIQKKDTTTARNDLRYDILSNPLSVDKDTSETIITKIPSTETSRGTYGFLNEASSNKGRIIFVADTGTVIDPQQVRINIDYRTLSRLDGTPTTTIDWVADVSMHWAFSVLFTQMRVKVNSAAALVFNYSDDFAYRWGAVLYMLKYMKREALYNSDEFNFTPIGDTDVTAIEKTDTETSITNSALLRRIRWFAKGMGTGTAIYSDGSLSIPLSVLAWCFNFPAFTKNIKKIEIDFGLTKSSSIPFKLDDYTTHIPHFYVQDIYGMNALQVETTTQAIDSVRDVTNSNTEKLGYPYFDISSHTYSTGSIVLNQRRNVQSVRLIQPATSVATTNINKMQSVRNGETAFYCSFGGVRSPRETAELGEDKSQAYQLYKRDCVKGDQIEADPALSKYVFENQQYMLVAPFANTSYPKLSDVARDVTVSTQGTPTTAATCYVAVETFNQSVVNADGTVSVDNAMS